MLPASKMQPRTANRGSGPGTALPFLKVENLTDKPKPVSIVAVETRGSRYNDVVVKLKMDGAQWFLGLKATSPVYHKLVESLGTDETVWPGREFSLFAEWNDFYGRSFISVKEVFPAKKSK